MLTQDLDSLTICTDYLNSDKHADFEGLEFYEYGVDEAVKLTPNCPKKTHQTVDLIGKRLLGFRAVLSDYINAPPYR